MQEYIQEQDDKRGSIPTLLVADTNLERDSEGNTLDWLTFCYKEKAPTCYHQMAMTWGDDGRFAQNGENRPRQIDNIMIVHNKAQTCVEKRSCERIESYRDNCSDKVGDERELFDTRNAISDHHAVLGEFTFKNLH